MAKNKSNMKKFVTGAVTATMVASAIAPVVAAAETKFNDIGGYDKTTQDKINDLVSKGIITGTSETTFSPTKSITRGQVVKLLGRYLVASGIATAPADWDSKARFTDVPVTHSDKDLVKNAAIVYEAGVFQGNNKVLNSAGNITRENMALVLDRAAEAITGKSFQEHAEGKEDNVADINKAKTEAQAAIKALNALEISTVVDFNPKNEVTRAQFATFLSNSIAVIDAADVPAKAEITSVSAINDTTVEVTFGQAIDKDFIREAEQDSEYFAIYKYGDTINGSTVVKSDSLRFSADGKTAEFTVGSDIEAGERYHVVLLDGNEPAVANVLHSFGPTELLKAADAPSFDVSAVADKVYINFNQKMKASALALTNYKVYDNGGQLLGPLSEYVTDTTNGNWTNATEKKTVEFQLAPVGTSGKKQLRAGETYKIKLETDLETDNNKKLNKDNTTITVKTPSVKDAAPQAKIARIIEADNPSEIVVVFDKDVNLLLASGADVTNLVDVKTASGKKVNASEVTVAAIAGNKNELKLTLTGADLDKALTYNVEIPANLVNNAVFPNAANESTKSLKATAQDNVAIKSLKAQFEVDPKVKGQANLLLTFDQRPDLDELKLAILDIAKFVIKEGTSTYTNDDFEVDAEDIKFYGGDSTGKTVVIEGINQGDDFNVFSNLSYIVELAAGSVQVDAYGGDGVTNQSKLKSTVQGTAVTEPVLDEMTLVSANEIKIDFEEPIDSNIDLNKINVEGFEADGNGFYAGKTLTGKNYLTTSVSGSTLTIKTKKANTVFATGFDGSTNIVEILKDAFTTKGTDLEVSATIEIDEGIDNAAPVLLDATYNSDIILDFTFTEAIEFEAADNDDIAKLFRTGGAATESSVGESVGGVANPLVVTFSKKWEGDSTDVLDVTVNYGPGQSTYIKDAQGNKVKATKLTGINNN